MIRIKDIAKLCGVSTATVSNVIHGKLNKVSPEVREKIEAAIKENGYVPNQSALSLASTKSDMIGIVVTDKMGSKYVMEDPYFSRLFTFLEREIRIMGKYMLLILGHTADEVLVQANRWNLDGLILCNIHPDLMFAITAGYDKPVVTIDSLFEYDCDSIVQIRTDDYHGGYLMGEYFAKMGHKNVAMIADNDVAGDHFRWKGFQKGLSDNGVNINDKSHIIIKSANKMEHDEFERVFPILRNMTALFCASDYYALVCSQHLRNHGVRIPEDISIAGFDDILYSTLFKPELTTIHQDVEEKAKKSVQSLLKMIDKKTVKHQMLTSVRLVERESVIQAE
ncbi:transcriptional regulator, LacI family [Lachnospiraceae bacterium KH1T2]|nr:transcriptional regulator, LacI family [Lachnospiraceae bacterium KH1T2]